MTSAARPARKRLGDLLVDAGVITPAQLSHALSLQGKLKVPLGRVLVSNGWLDEETLAEAIAYQADLPRVNLTGAAELCVELHLCGHLLEQPSPSVPGRQAR